MKKTKSESCLSWHILMRTEQSGISGGVNRTYRSEKQEHHIWNGMSSSEWVGPAWSSEKLGSKIENMSRTRRDLPGPWSERVDCFRLVVARCSRYSMFNRRVTIAYPWSSGYDTLHFGNMYVYTFLKSLFQCVPSNLHDVTCYGHMNTTVVPAMVHPSHWLKTRTLVPATSFPVWCTFCSFRGLTSHPDCYENFLGKLTHREDGNARPSWDHIHVYLLIRARTDLGVDISFIYIKQGVSLRRHMRDT